MKISAVSKFLVTAAMALAAGLTPCAQQVQGLAGVDFTADERIFDIMCAIHAAGYNYQLATERPDSIRKQVLGQMDLAKVKPELLQQMKDFFQRMNIELNMARQQSKYAALSLLLTPPPTLEYREGESRPPDDIRALAPFAPLVAAFREQAGLAGLWAKFRPEVLRFLSELREEVRTCVLGILKFGHLEIRLTLDRRLTMVPDLVNAPNSFMAIQLGGTYALFVSPNLVSVQRYRKFIIHEYLHLLLDPVFDGFARKLDEDQDLANFCQTRQEFSRYAVEPSLLVRESFFNALNLAVLKDLGAPATAAERNFMIQRDSPFLPWFEAQLEGYRQGARPLPEFVGDLTGKLKAAELATAADAALAAAKKPATDSPGGTPDPANQRIDALLELERLLRQEKLDEAEALAGKLIEKDSTDAEALFFMGQCKYARERYADALAVFDRVLDLSLAPRWVRGWALVRSGNCLVYLDRQDEAVRRFRDAANMNPNGGDRGAGEAAKRTLEKLEKEE